MDSLNLCPDCEQGQLFFSANGMTRTCGKCTYQEPVAAPPHATHALLQEIRASRGGPARRRGVETVQLIKQGIESVKSGNMDEGAVSLVQALKDKVDAMSAAEAWFWLAQTFDAAADKRACLEEALAHNPNHVSAQINLAILDGRLHADEIVAPEKKRRQTAAHPLPIDATHFICPRCSGQLNFDAAAQRLMCPYCAYRLPINAAGTAAAADQFGQGNYEQAFLTTLTTAKGHVQPTRMRTFLCHTCAIEFVLAPQTISLTCPYCNAVYVTETAETNELVPIHALIPFATTQSDAEQTLRQWFKKRKIERPLLTKLVGVYLPAWTFDLSGQMNWSGIVNSEHDYMDKGKGNYLTFYDDVLVTAVNNLPPSVKKAVRAFNLEALVAYDSRYLASWPAERYQISLAEASLAARKRVRDAMYREARRRVLSHEPIYNLKLGVSSLTIESYKHILLPVWIAHFKSDKVYEVFINGQTGQLHHDKPPGAIAKVLAKLGKILFQ